jgi:hypothetical protein
MPGLVVDTVEQIKGMILELLKERLPEGRDKMLIRNLASAVEKKLKAQNLPYWKSDFNKAIMDLYDENKIKLSELGKYATKV